jgi:hypothetical protein
MIKPDSEVVLKNNLYMFNIAFAEKRVKSKVNNLSSKNK